VTRQTTSQLDARVREVLPLTPVMFHVLLALADRNRHGLGIAKHADTVTGGHLDLGPGTLYGAIKRLLDSALVIDTDESPDDDPPDPRRRYYAITPLGRRALAIEATQMASAVKAARLKRVF
jgi:DNA-binding PadR family transcriptional regulator